ncbi:MAG TPA: hypothetical protein VF868_09195 [Bacteroidia bacterium]|jgi:hypothetical protein
MKTYIRLIILLSAFSNILPAQDTIIKRDQDHILAKILEISVAEIKYKSFDAQDGPTFVIRKSDVSRIVYKNGMSDVFEAKKPAAANTGIVNAELKADTDPRYILTLNDGTQLRGRIISQTAEEVVFLDNNFGEKKISRQKISNTRLEFGEDVKVFTLVDGSIITGKIINKNPETTVVETRDLGTITLPAAKIRNVRALEESKITEEGKIWFRNPNCTRYLFAPSAIQLKKGEGYYQNIYGAGNAVNFGLNDHITVGGGLAGPLGAYINAKVGFKLGKLVHVGGGAIVGNGFFPVNGNNLGVGLGFAVVTIGNYDNNITVGTGYGFLNSGGTTGLQEKPLFVANGMARVGKKFALVTENWVVNVQGDPFDRGINADSHYETFFSYAFRYMGQRSTLDAGFLNTPGLISKGWYIGIPYIGFVIRFGNYKEN